MRKPYFLLALFVSALFWSGCNHPSNQTAANGGTSQALPPANLPDIKLAGFRYPQDSTTIQRWIATDQQDSISLHGWGLWAALTSRVNDSTYVFETWLTKQDVNSLIHSTPTTQLANRSLRRSRHGKLALPSQFRHDPKLMQRLAATPANDPDKALIEMVSYSPQTANTLVKNRLFVDSTLQGRLNRGQHGLNDFLNFGLAVKPMLQIVPGPLASGKAVPYVLKVWNGPGTPAINAAFPPSKWPTYVLVDVRNRGMGQGQSQPVNQPVRDSLAITYNLNDFVHYRLTQAEADSLNKDDGGVGKHATVRKGDYAIVVGMHVTTSEINNWTWQTFWWAPNPETAYLPSSAAVVAARPARIIGAPRHYAMSIGYQMLSPEQPYEGGHSVGQSVYVYNPYLEGPFGTTTFKISAEVVTNGALVINNVGVRSNCMSCHMQATFVPKGDTSLGYIGDAYVARGMPRFRGTLRTAFLWSIQDMAERPVNQATKLAAAVPLPKH